MGVCSSNKDDSNLRKQSNSSSNGTENVVLTHKKVNSDSNLNKNNKIESK